MAGQPLHSFQKAGEAEKMSPASFTERLSQVGSPRRVPHCPPQRHRFHVRHPHIPFTGHRLQCAESLWIVSIPHLGVLSSTLKCPMNDVTPKQE